MVFACHKHLKKWYITKCGKLDVAGGIGVFEEAIDYGRKKTKFFFIKMTEKLEEK